MRPTQAVARPLTRRIMQGAAGRYTVYPNRLHNRSIITLKDHLVRSPILLTQLPISLTGTARV